MNSRIQRRTLLLRLEEERLKAAEDERLRLEREQEEARLALERAAEEARKAEIIEQERLEAIRRVEEEKAEAARIEQERIDAEDRYGFSFIMFPLFCPWYGFQL